VEGFAVAPKLHHGALASTIEEAKRPSFRPDLDRRHSEMKAALDYLRKHPSVSSASVEVVEFSSYD
jgi:hypothetical protein